MKNIFYVSIDNTQGMDAISLVESPAVETDFLCFEKETKPLQFSADISKHIISGVVMLADTPIYRCNPIRGKYWIVFSKDVIEQMILKYSKDGLWNSINLEHNDNDTTDKVILLESYIVNKERGINPKEFDVPEGSWICSFKVEDPAIWERIEKGEFKGFSLQGWFDLVETKMSAESDEIDSFIDEILK